MAYDGRGGCYIRFGVGRLHRFNAEGNSYWSNPVQVPTSGGILRVDDTANVYLLGSKVLGYRNGQLLFTINLQKIDTFSTILWDSLGVIIDTINTNNFSGWDFSQQNSYSTIAWPQNIAGQWDLRTQIVRSDGSTVFEYGGIPVSTIVSPKSIVKVLPSDSSTAVYVWFDQRAERGIYAQRLDTLGNPLWNTSDILVSLPELSYEQAVTDGSGGFIIAGTRENFTIRAQQVSKYGNLGEVITSVDEKINVPERAQLYQNYPNPFNITTNIKFDIPKDEHVRIDIYNLLGQDVKTIVDQYYKAGNYIITIEGGDLSSGIYFYKMQTSKQILVRKLTIIK